MKNFLNMRFLLLAGALLLAGCHLVGCDSGGFGSGGNEYDPPATTILEVRAEPDTVAQGEVIRFTCVIKDSLESGFQYKWVLAVGNEITVTDTNQYRWSAADELGKHRLIVEVDRPEEAVEPVQSGVDFVIVPND